MAYKIVQNWLPASKYDIKAPYALKPKNIMIHNTWNDAAAEN
ncbi:MULTISPECIES: hypothetical protein [Exiguobacterium]|nr:MULTISPECIES: hypothetical protein [Exiguobacterium]